MQMIYKKKKTAILKNNRKRTYSNSKQDSRKVKKFKKRSKDAISTTFRHPEEATHIYTEGTIIPLRTYEGGSA